MSKPAPMAVAKEVSEPRLKGTVQVGAVGHGGRGVTSCDSLARPNNACANGETFAGTETCGPNRKVCSRVPLPFSVPYVPLKSATAPRMGRTLY